MIANVHRASVHGLGATHYPQDLLDEWATPITDEKVARIEARRGESSEVIFLAELNGDVVGFSGLDASTREVTAVYVKPEVARTGVGSALLATVEEHARSLGFDEVWLGASLNAEAFYAAHGYDPERPGEHRLSTGRMMQMVLMKKSL